MMIHHTGYLVKRIEEAVKSFEKLGYKVELPITSDNTRDIYICFMTLGEYRIELIQPTGQQSPIFGLMKRHKNSPYHICYETTEFDKTVEKLIDDGFSMFNPPAPAPAIGDRRVAFFVGSEIGMFEILEGERI